GMLYQSNEKFDGLIGTEFNTWHRPDGSRQDIQVWRDPALDARSVCIPDPDPGELFADIRMQIYGLNANGTPSTGHPTMGGFVDNYMRQPPTTPAADPYAVMHYFTPDQVPVISQLARAFGVSDRWHASAPCQTWPNRFFAHTGTANGYVNNSPTHFPYEMETVFNRLSAVGKEWRIYFHDIPQTTTLAKLWGSAFTGHFHDFAEDFASDARAGNLPAYSFIEPRYFVDPVRNRIPNDEHPPHNVAYGERLIADVYNAVRGSPRWKQTLLVITYDEHGGCYDHVVPPPATPPDNRTPDGFDFSTFGVRVPAVIVSPYVPAGSIIRPPGSTPFDHTSIIATLRRLFGIASLSARDAAAPDLLGTLHATPDNDGPASITAPAIPPAPAQVARLAAKPPNSMQRSLATAAVQLPTAGADPAAHIRRLNAAQDTAPQHATAADAAADVTAHVDAFLNRAGSAGGSTP
ncbi:MAG TPA: alkaline phosphatase family protein, partial [Rhodopila sp.]|nr:alkaline phosphatase family protein [Rhodopila sp.]